MLEQLKNLQKANFDDWYNAFLGLEKRQQVLGVFVFVCLCLFLLWLPWHFLSAKLYAIEEHYLDYRKEAQTLKQTLGDYANLQKVLNQSSSQTTGEDNLDALIYNMAEEFGIPKKKVSLKSTKMPPGELFEQDSKDVDIKSVPFDQLMRLLDGIENNQKFPVVIKKLNLKVDRKNRQIINSAVFSVTTIKAKKG